MSFRFFIILLSLILVSGHAICQDEDAALERHAKADESNLAMAKFQINDIKARGIIVRLKTNKERIAAYRKAGNNKVADKMEAEARETNFELMDAFATHWTYSPVYFMESQNTVLLMQHDTLIAKTADLLRDTAIYMPHDSFYLMDYGVLMENAPPSANTRFKDLNKTEQSENPVSDGCLVLKDSKSMQLQYPLPYFTKVSLLKIGTNIQPQYDVNRFGLTAAQQLSRLHYLPQKSKEQNDSINRLMTQSFNYIIKYHSQNKYQKSVIRLNNRFIAYFCKRLDKDQNILCNDDPYYWWLRNPNIRYLTGLPTLEGELKINTSPDASPMK